MTDADREPGLSPRVEDGVLWLDGSPRVLLAGEYPYYRDPPRSWPTKLRAMKLAGLEVVSFYVPWRHHEVAGPDDRPGWAFDGEGNRDLVGFLRQIWLAGLLALPKPGPFVHAELPFGGLPDRVSPSNDPRRCAARSASGESLLSVGLALPSVQDPAFLADAGDWLRAVGAVLRPRIYPDGPIVALQIGNEGHYGETALALDALDYSPSGIEAFRSQSPETEPPRRWQLPARLEDLTPYLRWGEWASRALADGLESLAGQLDVRVPAFTNHSPAPKASGQKSGFHDSWLARGAWAGVSVVNDAYTNWTGRVTLDEEALVNYVLAARRRRGPNLEENWSLRWVDPESGSACVPVYHSLLGLACGATGLDVYTACAVGEWGEHLQINRDHLREAGSDPAMLDPPYGDAAPIRVDGGLGPSFPALSVLIHFLSGVGVDLMLSADEPCLTFCTYAPYAALGAWSPPAVCRVEGRAMPPSAADALIPFVRYCLRGNIPFALGDLGRLPSGPLVVASGFFMDAAAQRGLANHVRGGGALLLLGELPSMDDQFRPCQILADAIGEVLNPADRPGRVSVNPTVGEVGKLVDRWREGLPEVRRGSGGPEVLQFRRSRDGTRDQFFFFFSRVDEPRQASSDLDGGELTVALAPRGCAVVRVVDGRFSACYVKGINERTGDATPVDVRVGSDRLSSVHPCDLSIVRRGEDFDAKTQGGPPSNSTIVNGQRLDQAGGIRVRGDRA